MRIALIAAALCALAGLGGCGQKGPLYMPNDDSNHALSPASQPQPTR